MIPKKITKWTTTKRKFKMSNKEKKLYSRQ